MPAITFRRPQIGRNAVLLCILVKGSAAGAAGEAEAAAQPALSRSCNSQPPLIIGISGGSGCGKTTLAQNLFSRLQAQYNGTACSEDAVAVLSMDNYYRTLSREAHDQALLGEYNFDRIEAMDASTLAKDLRHIRKDSDWPMRLPSYDFNEHRRSEGSVALARPRVLIVEGLFLFVLPEIRELLDLKLFVQSDADSCLIRRLRRDALERGLDTAASMVQYERFVKPAYGEAVAPSAAYADFLVPTAGSTALVEEVVVGWIWSRISEPAQPAACACCAEQSNACADVCAARANGIL